MSIISSKNKLNAIDLQASKNEQDIGNIITVDFNKKPAHYFNYGYRVYNLITLDSIIADAFNGFGEQSFIFPEFNDKFLSFTKIIPKFQTKSDLDIEKLHFTPSVSWSKITGDKTKLLIKYVYRLTSEAKEEDSEQEIDFSLEFFLAMKNYIQPNLSHGTRL